MTPLELIQEIKGDKLNQIETQVYESAPFLTRIPTHQHPPVLQGYISKKHNPDFIFLDRMFIEVKGYVRDKLYRPMLAEFPTYLRRRYHVINCESKKQARDSLTRLCNKLGISVSEGPYLPGWVVEKALLLPPMSEDPTILWLDNKPKDVV